MGNQAPVQCRAACEQPACLALCMPPTAKSSTEAAEGGDGNGGSAHIFAGAASVLSMAAAEEIALTDPLENKSVELWRVTNGGAIEASTFPDPELTTFSSSIPAARSRSQSPQFRTQVSLHNRGMQREVCEIDNVSVESPLSPLGVPAPSAIHAAAAGRDAWPSGAVAAAAAAGAAVAASGSGHGPCASAATGRSLLAAPGGTWPGPAVPRVLARERSEAFGAPVAPLHDSGVRARGINAQVSPTLDLEPPPLPNLGALPPEGGGSSPSKKRARSASPRRPSADGDAAAGASQADFSKVTGGDAAAGDPKASSKLEAARSDSWDRSWTASAWQVQSPSSTRAAPDEECLARKESDAARRSSDLDAFVSVRPTPKKEVFVYGGAAVNKERQCAMAATLALSASRRGVTVGGWGSLRRVDSDSSHSTSDGSSFLGFIEDTLEAERSEATHIWVGSGCTFGLGGAGARPQASDNDNVVPRLHRRC